MAENADIRASGHPHPRRRLELAFEKLGFLIYDHPLVVLVLVTPFLLFFAYSAFSLRFETSVEHYLAEGDPTLKVYTGFQNRYGSDDRVVVGVVGKTSIFTPEYLDKLTALQEAISTKVPHVRGVSSLVNALSMVSDDGELTLGALADHFPETEAEAASLQQRLKRSTLYADRYYDADGRLALLYVTLTCPRLEQGVDAVLLELTGDVGTQNHLGEEVVCRLSNAENGAMITALKDVKAEFEADDFTIYLTGMPLLRQFLQTVMKTDSIRFLLLSTLVIIVLLYLMFGNRNGVLLPLAVVTCSLVSTIGTMAALKVPFQAPTRILPSFLIAIGIGASVHLLVIYYQQLQRGQSARAAVGLSYRHSGLAVSLTALTTAVGLASFSTATVAPVAELGFFGAVGVCYSLFCSLVLLPALIAILPGAGRESRMLFSRFSKQTEVVVAWITGVSLRYDRLIVVGALLLLIGAIIGVARLQLVHNPLLRLPPDQDLRIATEAIGARFKGLATVEILIDTGQKDGIASERLADSVADFARHAAEIAENGLGFARIFSLYDLVAELRAVLEVEGSAGKNDSGRGVQAAFLPQALLLFESSIPQTLNSLTDGSHQVARLTLMVPWVDAMIYGPLLEQLQALADTHFSSPVQVQFTGLVPLLSRTIRAAIESMVFSYGLAGIAISLIMVLLIGHFRLGLLAMFPNLLPILLTLGVMGWFRIPLDMYGLLIGSIALGLVVDDTIHFMHNFRRYYDLTASVERAVHLTLATSGLAMLATTVVLTCGAFVFMFSAMKNLFHFGLLTGIAVSLALLADFFLAPALMSIYHGVVDDTAEK